MSDVPVEPVFEIDEAVSYEWCHLAVYQHPTHAGQYVTFTDSGCSCNSWEPPTPEEIAAAEPEQRPDARRVVLDFISRNHWSISAGDGIRELERFETAMNALEHK